MTDRFTIVIACHNAVDYTKKCMECFVEEGVSLSNVVVVDNGSTDETAAYLASLPLGRVITNRNNLGCGVSWNQGALALQSEWTIIMNNDVLVAKDTIPALIETAEKLGLRIASPAMIEGHLDYDFNELALRAGNQMSGVIRHGVAHAVCMAIHKSVWMEIGYFAPIPKLWGFEDTLFFHRAREANIPMGIVGSSWLHHYGSITQQQIREELGLPKQAPLGNRESGKKMLKQNFFVRKWAKFLRNYRLKKMRAAELDAHGMTLHADRRNQQFFWR